MSIALHAVDAIISPRKNRNETHLDDYRSKRCGGQLPLVSIASDLPLTTAAHDDFGQLVDRDGTVLLCLYQWAAHEHPSLMRPKHGDPGNGLLLFFRVDDFDTSLPMARGLLTRLEEQPDMNPNTGTMEFSVRDPDGYYVTISALSAA